MGSAALFVLIVWWGATQALLWLVRLVPARALGWSALGLGALGATAAIGAADVEGAAGAYVGFTAGILIWAAFEVAFLSGSVLGIDTTARSPALGARAWAALRSILWHELALIATLVALALLLPASNKVALWTFVLLWAMRASAKLNLFLGVRNQCAEFLPEPVAHLARHFRDRALNPLFPVSVFAGTLASALLLRAGLDPTASAHDSAAALLLAALAALGTLEHWLMVTPLSARALFTTRPEPDTPDDTRRPLGRLAKAYT